MSNQAKFYDLPAGPEPVNRQVYAAAKAPFAYMWTFLVWALKPWLQALPFGMFASAAVTLVVSSQGAFPGWARIAVDTVSVGLVWTVYLGVLFLLVTVLRRIFE